MNIQRLLLFIWLLAMTSACMPDINAVRVKDANDNNQYEHNETLTVEADVTVKSGGAGTPIVYTRPRLPLNSDFQEAMQLTSKTLIGNIDGHEQYRFSGQLSLNYGAYDLRVKVPYSAWLTRQSVSTQTSLRVESPADCFSFDGGTMGFTMGKVTLTDHSERPDNVSLETKLRNWPEDASGHGSVSFKIDVQHFPSPPEEPRYWFIDFISPDLSQNTAWQQSQGMTVRISSMAGHLYAQPIVYIRGQAMPFAPKDLPSDEFLYYPISTAPLNGGSVWNVVQWQSSPNLPDGVREKIHIRIYGDADATSMNNNRIVYLDGVCPMPPGITPPGGEVVSPEINPIQ